MALNNVMLHKLNRQWNQIDDINLVAMCSRFIVKGLKLCWQLVCKHYFKLDPLGDAYIPLSFSEVCLELFESIVCYK